MRLHETFKLQLNLYYKGFPCILRQLRVGLSLPHTPDAAISMTLPTVQRGGCWADRWLKASSQSTSELKTYGAVKFN